MDFSFLSQINYASVAVATLVFFVTGSIWFSALFGRMWVKELADHNVIIQQPSQAKLMTCMGLTLLQNSMVSFAVACLVVLTGCATFASGLLLGTLLAVGFSATAIGGVFIWESRSVKLFLIDAGYQMAGVIFAAIILSIWR